MQSAFPGSNPQQEHVNETSGRGPGAKAGLFFLVGAVLLVAVAIGAYFVGMTRAPAPQPWAANAAPPPVPTSPAAPPTQPWTRIGTYGSWEARCATLPGATTRLCTAVLEVVDNKTKGVLMTWIVGPDDKGGLQSVFQTPTGIMVSSGVDVKLGNAAAHKINFQSCAPQQCLAAAPMNNAFVKEVVTAPQADVTLTAMNGRTLNFNLPVTGLDKALAAIKK
jgi:invasion protein IalB